VKNGNKTDNNMSFVHGLLLHLVKQGWDLLLPSPSQGYKM